VTMPLYLLQESLDRQRNGRSGGSRERQAVDLGGDGRELSTALVRAESQGDSKNRTLVC